MLRILLIEDDVNRYDKLVSWLPKDVRIVWAKDAGAAIGVLGRLEPGDFAGIMLDFDLGTQPHATGGERFNGGHVVNILLNNKLRDCPILVHSDNITNGPKMAERLSGAGYEVTRIAMRDLTSDRFAGWLATLDEPDPVD